jgi:adenylate cyclase
VAVDLNKIRMRMWGWLLISGLSIFLSVIGIKFDLFRSQENALWTPRASILAGSNTPDNRIKLIIVDQRSLDILAEEYQFQWPVSRQFYVPIIEMLNRGGAKAIGFDLVFSESSHFLVADDEAFAGAVKRSRVPVVVTAVPYEKGPEPNPAELERLIELNQESSGALSEKIKASTLASYPGALMPIKSLLDSGASIASVREDPDADGIFRRYSLGSQVAGSFVPSMALALYDKMNVPSDGFELNLENNDHSRKIINYRGAGGAYKSYSFIDIISSWASIESADRGESADPPLVDPSEFKDAVVIVGVWAAGLQDLRPTPLDPKFRGVEVHATALDNILHGNFVKEVSFVYAALIAAIFIGALCAGIIFVDNLIAAGAVSLLLIIALLVTSGFFALNNHWLPTFSPLLGMILASIGCFSWKYALEGRERRFLKAAFRCYVSPSVIEKIIADPSRLKLGGEKRELSIFFSDIKGFTAISERMEPSRLSELLNRYLTEMTGIIQQSGGTVDKYVGDAVVAFWNAPLDVSDHADRAVSAALDCQKRLSELAPIWQKEFGVVLSARIGIHTGVVSVGNFGSNDRFNYTMIGDAANLASRLEGANKKFGTEVLISEDTYKKLSPNNEVRALGAVRVLGREAPVQVFEPLSVGRFSKEHLEQFRVGLDSFKKGNRELAYSSFKALSKDPVATAYLARIAEESDMQTCNPVWILSDK